MDDDTEVETYDENEQSDLGSMGQGPHQGRSWEERCKSENEESDPFSELMDMETEAGCKEQCPHTLPPSPQQKLDTLCQVPKGVNGPAALGEATVGQTAECMLCMHVHSTHI